MIDRIGGAASARAGHRGMLCALLLYLCSCSSDGGQGGFCPTLGDQGPELTAGTPYLFVAHTLEETWAAVDLSGLFPEALPVRGLTGRAPNDLDVVGDRLFAVNSGENTISVIELPAGRTVGCIEIGEGANPWEFMVDPVDSTRGWLTTFLSGELLELDLERLRVLRRQSVGPGMEGLLVTGDRVAVTLTGFDGTAGEFGTGEVVVLDKASLAETARLAVPTNPQFLLAGPDGRAHVVCTGNFGAVSGRVARIEGDWSAVVDTLELGGSPGRAVLAPDGVAYAASYFGGVLAYDAAAFRPLRGIDDPILSETGFTALTVRANILYAANFENDSVVRVSLLTGEILGEVLLGDGPVALAVWEGE